MQCLYIIQLGSVEPVMLICRWSAVGWQGKTAGELALMADHYNLADYLHGELLSFCK